ncbi:MAG: hypothetical protein ABIM89_11240 [Mycobacteriales bacterium]
MFVQIIQGRVSDEAEAKARLDQWVQELAPGATGWLGSTAGVTDEGELIIAARFESEQAARRNSDRAEQDAWWTQSAKLFRDEPRFKDSRDVVVDLIGDPNDAGFVQVIQGRSNNPERARELWAQDSEAWAKLRPDIIGNVEVDHDDGEYTLVLYFTTEAAAREGERKELPAALQAQMAEMQSLEAGEQRFLDLRRPWIHSAS